MAFVTVDTEVQVVEPWGLHKRGALAPPSPVLDLEPGGRPE